MSGVSAGRVRIAVTGVTSRSIVKTSVLAASAGATWATAASLATLATVGFVHLHTADTAAARQATVITATA
jgi:hypothetical protein